MGVVTMAFAAGLESCRWSEVPALGRGILGDSEIVVDGFRCAEWTDRVSSSVLTLDGAGVRCERRCEVDVGSTVLDVVFVA